jgi:enoyl-CoA hydratase
MAYQDIIYEKIGPVARLWHNRPELRNAENTRLLDELNTALGEAEADREVRVIVFAGKGGHFSAGHDLKEGRALRAGFGIEERWEYEEQRYFDYCLNILNSPKPTIAQVDGACIAGGFMLANMCDLMVASEDAFFADPVVHTMAVAAVEVLVHPGCSARARRRRCCSPASASRPPTRTPPAWSTASSRRRSSTAR